MIHDLPAIKPPSCRPASLEDYQKRLASFTPEKWLVTSSTLSPIACARIGFSNSSENVVSCSVCGESYEWRRETSSSFMDVEDLRLQHDVYCPWRSLIVPVPITSLSGKSLVYWNLLEDYYERLSAMKKVLYETPIMNLSLAISHTYQAFSSLPNESPEVDLNFLEDEKGFIDPCKLLALFCWRFVGNSLSMRGELQPVQVFECTRCRRRVTSCTYSGASLKDLRVVRHPSSFSPSNKEEAAGGGSVTSSKGELSSYNHRFYSGLHPIISQVRTHTATQRVGTQHPFISSSVLTPVFSQFVEQGGNEGGERWKEGGSGGKMGGVVESSRTHSGNLYNLLLDAHGREEEKAALQSIKTQSGMQMKSTHREPIEQQGGYSQCVEACRSRMRGEIRVDAGGEGGGVGGSRASRGRENMEKILERGALHEGCPPPPNNAQSPWLSLQRKRNACKHTHTTPQTFEHSEVVGSKGMGAKNFPPSPPFSELIANTQSSSGMHGVLATPHSQFNTEQGNRLEATESKLDGRWSWSENLRKRRLREHLESEDLLDGLHSRSHLGLRNSLPSVYGGDKRMCVLPLNRRARGTVRCVGELSEKIESVGRRSLPHSTGVCITNKINVDCASPPQHTHSLTFPNALHTQLHSERLKSVCGGGDLGGSSGVSTPHTQSDLHAPTALRTQSSVSRLSPLKMMQKDSLQGAIEEYTTTGCLLEEDAAAQRYRSLENHIMNVRRFHTQLHSRSRSTPPTPSLTFHHLLDRASCVLAETSSDLNYEILCLIVEEGLRSFKPQLLNETYMKAVEGVTDDSGVRTGNERSKGGGSPSTRRGGDKPPHADLSDLNAPRVYGGREFESIQPLREAKGGDFHQWSSSSASCEEGGGNNPFLVFRVSCSTWQSLEGDASKDEEKNTQDSHMREVTNPPHSDTAAALRPPKGRSTETRVSLIGGDGGGRIGGEVGGVDDTFPNPGRESNFHPPSSSYAPLHTPPSHSSTESLQAASKQRSTDFSRVGKSLHTQQGEEMEASVHAHAHSKASNAAGGVKEATDYLHMHTQETGEKEEKQLAPSTSVGTHAEYVFIASSRVLKTQFFDPFSSHTHYCPLVSADACEGISLLRRYCEALMRLQREWKIVRTL